MNDWSEDRDKVLCRCGAVSWTNTKFEEGRYLLKEGCPGCDKKDDVFEIGSIQKMSHKKAEKIIETFCDLLEANPMQIIGGGIARQVENLAQHIEDINRINAAERIRKVWKMVMDGMMKGAQSLFPGIAPQKPEKPKEFVLVSGGLPRKDAGEKQLMVRPGCRKCHKPIMDYKPELRWHHDGTFCWECRSLDKETRIKVFEEEIVETKKFAGDLLAGVVSMNKQLEDLQEQK